MIKRKIILDKRGIWNKKLMTLILVILVLASILILIFRVDINNYLRNLPGYSVPENDTVIDVGSDEESDDSCVEIGKINLVEGSRTKWSINIDDEETNLRWEVDGGEGYVKIEGTKVAEVTNGVVSINPGFFNSDSEFDLDSREYQEIRFIPKVDVSYFIKIHKSYDAGSNFLRKCEEEDIEIDYGWPENPIILDTVSLKFEWKKKLKIDFSPYIILLEDSHFEFLYLKDRNDYMEIKGCIVGLFGADLLAIDKTELGRIYPDGSVWLNRERLTEKRAGAKILSEVVVQKFRGIYKPYYESNLRVDYEEIKNFLE